MILLLKFAMLYYCQNFLINVSKMEEVVCVQCFVLFNSCLVYKDIFVMVVLLLNFESAAKNFHFYLAVNNYQIFLHSIAIVIYNPQNT